MGDSQTQPVAATGLLLLGGCGLALLVLGLALWGGQTSMAAAVMAQGEIARGAQRYLVQHPTGGVVAKVLVSEGDEVARGQPLATLDVRAETAELAALEAELFEVELRIARFRAEASGAEVLTPDPDLVAQSGVRPEWQVILHDERALFQAGRTRLAGELAQLTQTELEVRMQIAGYDAQAGALSVQIDLLRDALQTQQDLVARGLVAKASLLPMQSEQAALNERMARLSADRALAVARQAAVAEDRISLMATQRERTMAGLSEVTPKRRLLRAQAARLRQVIGDARLVAPVGGIVHGLSISTPQAVLGAGDVLAAVIPPQARPSVSLRLPVRSADVVAPGQSVVLRFSSLDQKNTPQLSGVVTRIAPEPIEDRRSAQSYFPVEVSILTDELAKLPEGAVLLPGMPVESFIRTRDQAPLFYLTKPLADYFARAFREG